MTADSLEALSARWVASKNTSRPSPNTVAARNYDLAAIAKLLDPEGLAELTTTDLTVQSLETAIGDYASSHAASSTSRVMSTWKQFCLWLVREHRLASNPLDHIDGPARTPWVPKPLQPADLAAVAQTSSQPPATARNPWPERDEALFALLIAAGVRISEAINLQIGDCYLDDDPPRLRITGKDNKTRVVPIPPEAVTRLHTYLESRDIRTPRQPENELLLRSDGRPMTRSSVDHLIRGWFRQAGRTPPKGALAHSFRHTYATLLIDNGASLPEIQQLLGHADLATTQAYLGVTAKGLQEAALSNPARKLL
ncbi:MAG: site-specific recombinase XerD [Verrucomicrobiales bacterium]|jgi:site-specific recombinase XerD